MWLFSNIPFTPVARLKFQSKKQVANLNFVEAYDSGEHQCISDDIVATWTCKQAECGEQLETIVFP
jgi:hypothetical protein